jgi:hypothetical protein
MRYGTGWEHGDEVQGEGCRWLLEVDEFDGLLWVLMQL